MQLKKLIPNFLLLFSIIASSPAFSVQTTDSHTDNLKAPLALVIGHASALRDTLDLKKANPDFQWQTEPVAGRLSDRAVSTIRQQTYYWEDFERSVQTVEQDLLDALKKSPAVIILTERPAWEIYPESVRKAILAQVKNGAVLSVFGPVKALKKDLGAEMRPCRLTNDFEPTGSRDPFKITACFHGQGKVLMQPGYLDHRYGFAAPQLTDKGEFQYWMARYGQLLRNALNKKSGSIARVHHCLLNSRGQEIQNLDRQPSGKYFLIDKKYDKNGLLVAASGRTINRTSDFGISSLTRLSPLVRKSGDELTLQPVWKKKSDSGVTRLILKDSHGRIFAENFFAGTPDKISVKIPGGSTSVYNTAAVSYTMANQPAESAETFFTLPENRIRKSFYFLTWNTALAESVRHHKYFDTLKEQGIDGFTHMKPEEKAMQIMAANNLLFIPYTTFFHKSTLPWLLDAERQAKTMNEARNAARLGRQYGILAHSLGDENYVSAFTPKGVHWDHPIFWKGFHDFLKKKYTSLENLNRKWKRSYQDWSEIRFKNEQEMFSFEAPGAWVDCRQYVSSIFINEQISISKAIKAIDSRAYVGWDGGEQYSSYDGYDLAPYVSSFDLSNVYTPYFMDKTMPNKIFTGYCMRSFAPAGSLQGLWMNSASYPNELYITPYMALFSGIRSIWWWHAVFPEEEVTALKHDLKPGIPFKETAKAVQEIKQGPADVLAQAQPADPQIAIYYSAVNFHASNLSAFLGNHMNNLGFLRVQWNMCPASKMNDSYAVQRKMWAKGKPAGHYAVAFKSFMTLIKDLNLDAQVVSPRQILQGELKKYKVLVLPFTEALSDSETEAIRNFVKEGGCLIGDYRTAVRDEVCNFRTAGALDDVFGIVQKAPFSVQYHPENLVVDSPRKGFRLPITFSQKQLTLKGGRAMGYTDSGVPSFIINQFGKGYALYFNCDFYQYHDLRREKRESDIRDYWRDLLLRNLNFPLWQVVKSTDHIPVSAISVFHFQEKEARYVGLIPDRQLNENATKIKTLIPMKSEGHLYDVLGRKYLGYGKIAQITLTRGLPALLAVLPNQITAPMISGPDGCQTGDRISFDINAGTGTHTLKIQVIAPDGRECPYYSQILHISGKSESFSVPTALNDLPGTWKLKATELVSGLTRTFRWTLNPQ